MKAYLVLEDGTVYEGSALGVSGSMSGEVVFTTGMTGYQETLTDPSYAGQIVTMTYPLIGNCGANDEDMESPRPFLHGFVVKEACASPSNWRQQETLQEMLQRFGVIGIEGVDTRSLTRKLRSQGTMKGMICSGEESISASELAEMAEQCQQVDRSNLIRQVTTREPYRIDGDGYRVTVIDYGVKRTIISALSSRGCSVTVMPATSSAQQILETEPDGVLLSNGPGDPRDAMYAMDTVKELLGHKPMMGICIGHQFLSMALGAKVLKLKFGHRGGNHPVKELSTGRVHITTQNHGYAVDGDTIDTRVTEVTHISLNDGTVEGIRHRWLPAWSIQFHPEASPGPRDTWSLFDGFVDEMARHRL